MLKLQGKLWDLRTHRLGGHPQYSSISFFQSPCFLSVFPRNRTMGMFITKSYMDFPQLVIYKWTITYIYNIVCICITGDIPWYHIYIYVYIYIRLTFACKDKCLWRTSQQTIRWRCPDAESFRSENPDVTAVQNDCPSKIGWASFCELREHSILPLLNRMTNWLTFLLVHLKSFQHGHFPFWHGQNLRELWQLWVSHLARFSSRTCHGSWDGQRALGPSGIRQASDDGNLSRRSIVSIGINSLGNPVMLRSLGLNFPQKCTEMQSMQSC